MRRHVAGCPVSVEDRQRGKTRRGVAAPVEAFLIEASAPHSLYWLLAAVAVDAPLCAMDDLLRSVWLECCGHLSEFEIGGAHYQMSVGGPREPGVRSMGTKAGAILRAGTKFSHVYDFGTSTCLALQVIDVLPWSVPSKSAILLANNHAPQYLCSSCGKPAVSMAMDDSEDIFYCTECGPEEEDAVLPIVNSPRIGRCGYTGPGAPV
jgi:hypothetical protein